MIAVLSCGRGGSKWLAENCQAMGLDFKHEKLGRNGGVGWNLALNHARSVALAEVLHQVREPLGAIGSLTTHHPKVFEEVGWLVNEPEVSSGSLLGRAAGMWYHYNRWCEARAEWTYRLDEVREGHPTLRTLCRRLGRKPADWPALPPSNQRPHVKVSRADLEGLGDLGARVLELAGHYGFKP